MERGWKNPSLPAWTAWDPSLPRARNQWKYIYFFNTPSLQIKIVLHQYRGWLKCIPTLLNRECIKTPIITSSKAVPLPNSDGGEFTQPGKICSSSMFQYIQWSRGHFSEIEADCQLPILWFNSFFFPLHLKKNYHKHLVGHGGPWVTWIIPRWRDRTWGEIRKRKRKARKQGKNGWGRGEKRGSGWEERGKRREGEGQEKQKNERGENRGKWAVGRREEEKSCTEKEEQSLKDHRGQLPLKYPAGTAAVKLLIFSPN